MRDVALQFLTGVLGTDGARALARTAEREPALTAVLVPRTALAWLRDLTKHEGNLPGVETSYLKFVKNEVGYAGVVSLPGDVNYEFEGAQAEHVAAAIAYAVGTVGTPDPAVRDLTLARLGKSIDALASAQVLVKALPKALAPLQGRYAGLRRADLKNARPGATFYATSHEGEHIPFNVHTAEVRMLRTDGMRDSAHVYGTFADPKATNRPQPGWYRADALFEKADDTKKSEPPGQTHQPTTQQGAQEPQPPQKQPKTARPKLPKAPKLPALKVEKSEAAQACALCGSRHFDTAKFTGCMCFKDLAKHVRTTVYSDGYVLEFGPNYPAGAWPELRKALKGDD